MHRDDRKKKASPLGTVIGLLVLLLVEVPELLGQILPLVLILAAIGLVGYLAYRLAKSGRFSVGKHTRQEVFDDCPQKLFCFHTDKGEHHVRKGSELDPWDRPDIDISKYQRRHTK